MSIETWKKEFYPVSAGSVKPGLKAIEHSLKKWKGLLSENMARHGVFRYSCMRILDNDGGYFEISTFTCALCHIYLGERELSVENCSKCPLYKAALTNCNADTGPWASWVRNADAREMVLALDKARVDWIARYKRGKANVAKTR